MARMYPDVPCPNTRSKAELKVFNIFKEGLSDDYTVFHSVAWQVRGARRGIQDGETDFIIVNSKLDLLIMEVKGGAIRYNGNEGRWFSNDNLIKNPFNQVKGAKYSLLAKLKELPQWEKKWLNIGCAVAFPDVRIYDDPFLYAPRELILDLSDTQKSISSWIEKAFRYLRAGEEYREPNCLHEDIDALIQLLSPSMEFHVELSREIEIQENIIKRLTDDQFIILDFLLRHRRVSIAGCAGSGKTLVAIEKAFRLSKEGFSTLLLCHNPYLADFLSRRISSDLVEVVDFFSWIRQILNEEQVQMSSSQWSQFLEPSEKDLEIAFDKVTSSKKKYDAIIVDEGQDFRETWWIIVEAALRDLDKSILYIFHDDNQALYLYGSQFKYPIKQAPHTLSKNCRNAGRIFELIQRLHPQAPEPSLQLRGKGIVKDFVCNRSDVFLTVSNAVREARELIDHQYQLVLLTSEISSPGESILNAQEILLRDKVELIPRWQEAVRDYIKFPKIVENLSPNSYPSIDDIVEVTHRAQRLLQGIHQFRDEEIFGRWRSIRWGIQPNGKMFLRGIPDNRGHRGLDYRQFMILRFFADREWANDIPKMHTKVKIMAIDEKRSSDDATYIPLHTVASFKGLEAHGVILFYWGHYPTGDELLALNTLYVGLSRAKHLLYFVSPIPLLEVLERQDIYFPDPNVFRLDMFT